MPNNPIALTIRAKKLGALIRDARLSSHRSVAECAQMMQVTPEQFEAFELGEASPSLPELELLSLSLNIPVEHFWGADTLQESHSPDRKFDQALFVKLRQKTIGVLIRKSRMEAGLTLEGLAEICGIPQELLQSYELGEAVIPVPSLDVIASALNRPVREFQDRHGPVGSWAAQQKAIQDFMALPPELQVFISKPINRPYLELAQRLSEMSVEKLRAVAEGLLEITL